MTSPPSLMKLASLLTQVDQMLSSPVPEYQARGRELLAFCEKHYEAACRVVEVECSLCGRWPRAWFATGVRRGKLKPLCSRACVLAWREEHPGARVMTKDGREWRDDWAAGRRAA